MADILHEEIFSSLNFRCNNVQEWGGGGGGGGAVASLPPLLLHHCIYTVTIAKSFLRP